MALAALGAALPRERALRLPDQVPRHAEWTLGAASTARLHGRRRGPGTFLALRNCPQLVHICPQLSAENAHLNFKAFRGTSLLVHICPQLSAENAHLNLKAFPT